MAYKRQLGTGIAVPIKKKSVRKTQTKINRDQTQSEGRRVPGGNRPGRRGDRA